MRGSTLISHIVNLRRIDDGGGYFEQADPVIMQY